MTKNLYQKKNIMSNPKILFENMEEENNYAD